jgi:glycine dehydrogenase
MGKINSYDKFEDRHIGINELELAEMLQSMNINSLEQLIDETVPSSIRAKKTLNLPESLSEFNFIRDLKKTAMQNVVCRNYIGMGYYGTITPSVILRNVFQNPGWYTQYTPYQAEIAQGRLEAILNFQTVVSEMSGLPIANASLLDEGTAAGEAMAMFYHLKNKKAKDDFANEFFVTDTTLPATIDVLKTRAIPLGIKVIVGDWEKYKFNNKTFGIFLQYPNIQGNIEDYSAYIIEANSKEVYVTMAADLMALALLKTPGELGADCCVGNSQRFGVPMGYGGPHAAFFACKDDYKRLIPGRIIGVSVDVHENKAYRMALQTREQHIRREKATSNICTAQALLAIMAGMYAVYHGPAGLKNIAERIHYSTVAVANGLQNLGYTLENKSFFDTITVAVDKKESAVINKLATKHRINFWYGKGTITIAIDETTNTDDLQDILHIFGEAKGKEVVLDKKDGESSIPANLLRTSAYLQFPIFNMYHTESNMMRYIKRLENKDLSLTHSMISLGSCTMKLNAATQLIPVSWESFANIHPFAPLNQTKGYQKIFKELSDWLCEITGFDACSLQPNSGAQGEYAGLLTIRAYHIANKQANRNIALIPSSAHGTNPASAVMAGMEVVVVDCDERGNIDMNDLKSKAEQYKENLSCLMVTYPSTHGVFETTIKEICAMIHTFGGKVYMDGANMNAQVGLTSPGLIGADVCHLNLHKTFAIPHGGGGPGMGPICVNNSLAPYLPGHTLVKTGGSKSIPAVSSAPYGSASILLISYAYIRMLGAVGVTNATKYAILNANYIKERLEKDYQVLYTGENGRAAHELIIDLRPFKAVIGAEDVAKRLMDYGFHAPTLSFPVAGTIMIEPTESESKAELDRFCNAMLAIRKEIDEIANGDYTVENNVLANAPHTLSLITNDAWELPYSREKAAFPLTYLREGYKFWASVSRVNNAAGDRNLICTCAPMEAYVK